MPRFFVPDEAIADKRVTITGGDAFHVARSLRMATGDLVTVCDMQRNEYLCRLTKIRDDACECEILACEAGRGEPPAEITLFAAYPKGDKLELVVQKAVELGAASIVPFESARCIKRPRADKEQKQTERLNRIAEEAAKQCGRALLPRVSSPLSFAAAMERAARAELPLFCYEGKDALSMKRVLEEKRGAKSVSVVVGSEGGFTPEENEAARTAGLVAVNLGPRILRCETAPLYALSALSYFFEL